MTIIILLIIEDSRLVQKLLRLLMRRDSVMKQIKHSIKSHRYELVHVEDADFIAYQRKFGDGLWQTVSTWIIPRTEYGEPSFIRKLPVVVRDPTTGDQPISQVGPCNSSNPRRLEFG